jgi:LacI family transcriptional regulator
MNLEDIAKQAGVSRSTVSRVINNEGYVSKHTRARVMEIIERLNFSPNHAARTLVTQRSNVIGIVMPGTANVFFGDNSYFPMLLQGIAEATNKHNHSMLLWLGQLNEDPEHFSQRIIRNRICDGLIVASITNDDPLIGRLVDSIPNFVMVERPTNYQDRISYVTADNIKGGQMATEHLINLGHKRIAHITGHMNISDGQDRVIGYRRALERAGIAYNPDLVYEGRFTYEGGYNGMKALLPQKPDAVFAASDTAAFGAMRAIQEVGLRIPQDIAIIGFDDLDGTANAVPPLTTIRQPVQQKGAAALTLLLDLISGKTQAPHQVILPVQLVIRESCGANL